MRWTFSLILVLAGFLLFPPGASAIRTGGHNAPTRKLETAFKVLGGVRVHDNGCYPAPRRGAKLIEIYSPVVADVVPSLGSVDSQNVVSLIARRSSCGRVVMALRARGRLYILDTSGGEVYIRGHRNQLGDESRRGGRGPLRALTLASRSFVLRKPDRAKRLEVLCPRGSFPLGGVRASLPAVGTDGEGIYPHSYERLGTQRGFHISALLIDPTPKHTTRRSATI